MLTPKTEISIAAVILLHSYLSLSGVDDMQFFDLVPLLLTAEMKFLKRLNPIQYFCYTSRDNCDGRGYEDTVFRILFKNSAV